MKKFFQNKKLLTAFVILVIVLGLLTISVRLRTQKKTPSIVQRIGNGTVAVVARVVDWPVKTIAKGVDSVEDILQTETENDHLKQQLEALAQTKARNNTLEQENHQLKQALHLKETLTDYSLVTGSVISRSPDTWSDILVIDQGSNAGIKKNMAVMSGGGVIGRVIEVDTTTSKVELITTTAKAVDRFAVEADSSKGKRVHGIISVTGNGTLAFTQVIDSAKLKKGTKVYTSGMGGRSPKGLLIGMVAKTTKDSFGLSNLVEIKPAGNLNDPSVVTVIKRKVSD